jgi:predicted nicotinamide N-methyase
MYSTISRVVRWPLTSHEGLQSVETGGTGSPETSQPSLDEATLTISFVEQLVPSDAVAVLEGGDDLTGLLLWPAAEALSAFVSSEGVKGRWKHLRILELGAGVGLVGLTMSLYSDHVVITDSQDEALALVRQNIENNKNSLVLAKTIKVCKLQWGEDSEAWRQEHQQERFDIIIASDILYQRELLQPLFQTVEGMLANKEEARFIVMYSSRGKKLDLQLFAVADQFNFTYEVEEAAKMHPRATTSDDEQIKDLRLCTFKRRNA